MNATERAVVREGTMSDKKRYLGDGAYADFDGYMIVLTAEDGIRATNTVYLEPDVWKNLVQFVEDLKAKGGTDE